ncbi:NAD-dependent succinate-semialdehyde dehydrogenase [Cupriavidus sp. CV2]|uniref:NAD-dependent succinate-semialdehyde dehydrogenase n=1 Tax=Cupriavidus ulmosensis TaxID=3065913 RepID=UPI00296AE08E|nr:NAD-dependent succinate-semialdehyde dehydrogenase [Cupriavidus sp. CV2]MDW3686001.1 NAD-dependent succinate-semialdehyde dehydrogenase [Cupriavidus sp. CV2]
MNRQAQGAAIPGLLREAALFRQQCYIDGSWCDADDGVSVAVINPATGGALGTVPDVGAAGARRAIAAANTAWPAWRAKTAKERATLLRNWHDLMHRHLDDLALLLTLEQGKPLHEARSEIAYAAAFLEWFAEEGKRVYGDTIPGHLRDKRIVVSKEPVGVCAAIIPWNFPAAMLTRKAGPALAAGCTMVLKPASATPYSALALAVLAERAGIPRGVFNVVTGSASAIGRELCAHTLVRKVSFTGSTEIGKILLEQCAGGVKKTSMELGGNAPFIVFEDADIDAAVEGAIDAKYRNAGQTCVCANRFLVHASVYDSFAAKLTARVAALRVGNGLEPGITIGPLIDEAAVRRVEAHIADALQHGASVTAGGGRHALGGSFFEPTVLTGVAPSMQVMREETFGPVAALCVFSHEQDALQWANDTPLGLAAYFYTRDLSRAWRVAEQLEYGIVGLNTGLISTEVAPFGGVKESGSGREGSKYGVDDYLQLKYLCMGIEPAPGPIATPMA